MEDRVCMRAASVGCCVARGPRRPDAVYLVQGCGFYYYYGLLCVGAGAIMFNTNQTAAAGFRASGSVLCRSASFIVVLPGLTA